LNYNLEPNHDPASEKVRRYRLLEGIEYIAAWCSVDNWQLLTCGVYFNGELKGGNDKR